MIFHILNTSSETFSMNPGSPTLGQYTRTLLCAKTPLYPLFFLYYYILVYRDRKRGEGGWSRRDRSPGCNSTMGEVMRSDSAAQEAVLPQREQSPEQGTLLLQSGRGVPSAGAFIFTQVCNHWWYCYPLWSWPVFSICS